MPEASGEERGIVMTRARGRLLVALDGSEQAFEAVRYLSRLLRPDDVEVTLFHVFANMPEYFWDIEKQPEFRSRLQGIGAWAAAQEEAIRAHMDRAREVLLGAGLPERAVEARVQNRKVGVARDIVAEAERGDYDAVVVGRWGLGRLKDLVFGSVASKLVGRLVDIPLWVVGGSPSVEKVLIAVDGSAGSMKSVAFAGAVMGEASCRFTLLHVIRSPNEPLLDTGDDAVEPEPTVSVLFDGAMARLGRAGIAPGRIEAMCVRDVSSRAKAIVDEARSGGYGTIVVGRRGLSRVEEFFIGRVSNKVVQLATDLAVLVVS